MSVFRPVSGRLTTDGPVAGSGFGSVGLEAASLGSAGSGATGCACADVCCCGCFGTAGACKTLDGPVPSRGTTIASGVCGAALGWPAISFCGSGTASTTTSFDCRRLPSGNSASSVSCRLPGGSGSFGNSTHSPRWSAWISPITVSPSRTVTLAFGAARPAITASPLGLTRTTSKLGARGAGVCSGTAGGVCDTVAGPAAADVSRCCACVAGGAAGAACCGASSAVSRKFSANAARTTITPITPMMKGRRSIVSKPRFYENSLRAPPIATGSPASLMP